LLLVLALVSVWLSLRVWQKPVPMWLYGIEATQSALSVLPRSPSSTVFRVRNDLNICDSLASLTLVSTTAKAYQVEVTDAKAVEKVVNEVVKDLNGRLDVCIANAGVPWTQGPMVDGPLEHYRDVVGIDLDGTFYCAKYAADHWRRQKEEGTDSNGNKLTNLTYGSFVATASMSGHIVNIPQMQAAYNAAKTGVIHLCKLLSPLAQLLF
jgi:NAD(P)-dependent dehydrogenase (short-subunit alcohol dehydrogenase family)